MDEEYYFTCPYCYERVSFLLDLSAEGQIHVEDCEICCSPVEIDYQVEDGRIVSFDARKQ
jgi:transcription elongation factor Elf1